MKKLSILVIIVFLLSSCNSAEVPPTLTSTPESTQAPVSTATETPSPTLTLTPTLAPFKVDCIINDKTSTEKDCQLIRDAVDLGRRYLLNNFGRDITGTLQVKLLSQPNNVRGGSYDQGFSGHIDSKDPNNGVIEINTAHPFWSEYTGADNLYRHTEGIIHEFTHFWELQHGCWKGDNLNQGILNFLNEGQAQYIADMAIGKPELINSGQSVVNWTHWKYDENLWFNDTSTDEVAFKQLVDQYSPNQYMNYCDLMLQGTRPDTAFQSMFGTTIKDFRSQFKERILGILKDCTQATCGDAQASNADTWKLSKYDDHTLTEPNLIVNFTDESGKPAQNTIFTICNNVLTFDCTGGEDRPIENGKFMRPLKAGTYAIYFCDPGYAENSGNPIKCGYEIKPFEVVAGEVKTIDFQFHGILNPEGTLPNFAFKLQLPDGTLVPNQYIQLCSDELISRHCLNTHTDAKGEFNASLKLGKYMMRLVMPGQGLMDPRGISNPDKYGMHIGYAPPGTSEYEISNIDIKDGGITELTYQFPTPNIIINFKDIYGQPLLSDLILFLCKAKTTDTSISTEPYVLLKNRQLSDENADCNKIFQADKSGTFQTKLPKGKYYVFFDAIRPRWTEPYDYELADINITSETEITEINFQPK